MADQFENQLPQKNDAKWVRALDASGNPILISKEDLASVVGGLIGVATSDNNGLMPAGLFVKHTVFMNKSKPATFRANGLLYVKDIYSYGGYVLYFATFNQVKAICNPAEYDISIKLSMSNGILTASTDSTTDRKVEFLVQNIL